MLGSNSAKARRRRLLHLRTSGHDAIEHDNGSQGASSSEESLFAEDFFEMCGSQPPLNLVVEDELSGEERLFQIERPYAIVGRNERCDINLPGDDVSRRHVYIQVLNGGVIACDLGSSTGTLWNGVTGKLGWLTDQQSIAVGHYRLRLPADADQLSETTRRLPTLRDEGDPSSEYAHPIYLDFANNRRGDSVWQVNRDLTLIGRSKACKLQLSDPSISEVHAALVRTPAGAWIVDLLGRGGTFLDGESVNFASLSDGQNLRVGIFRIVVRFEQPHSRGAHLSL